MTFPQRSLVLLIAALLSHSAFGAEAQASPSDPEWKKWLVMPPPEPPFTDVPLREKLAGLPEAQKLEVARFMFDTWSPNRYQEQHDLLEAMGTSFHDLVTRWAEKDFENVFRRAEEWEGYGGHMMRVALVREMAAKNPVGAARFMSDRLNPMSLQYYYYVLIAGLMPSLLDKPISVIQPALEAIASGRSSLDEFRWGDATASLAQDKTPWKSPDLDADWQELLGQNPGQLRDILLGLVLRHKLSRDFDSAIKIDIAATGARFRDLEQNLRGALPKDPSAALKHLPDADPALMDLWVQVLIEEGMIPNWSAWAEQVLAIPPGARRDTAVARLTRLWLQHNRLPARDWSATLSDAAAQSVAEREIQVVETIAEARDSWIKAYETACAMTDLDSRRRTLLGVFKAGTSEDAAEIATRASAASQDPDEVSQLLDSWTLGRIEWLLKAERHEELFKMVLSLRDPQLRRIRLMGRDSGARSCGFEKARKVILDSNLGADEQRALLLSTAIDHVAGITAWPKKPGESGGFQAAMLASVQIADPRLRFIQQRSIVHESVWADSLEALRIIESSGLDDETRARLLKEYQRVARWHVPKRQGG